MPVALFELGGVYLIGSWFKESKSIFWAFAGFSLLMIYGSLNTLQVRAFRRTYATYEEWGEGHALSFTHRINL